MTDSQLYWLVWLSVFYGGIGAFLAVHNLDRPALRSLGNEGRGVLIVLSALLWPLVLPYAVWLLVRAIGRGVYQIGGLFAGRSIPKAKVVRR